MKVFTCPVCSGVIFFENTQCLSCGHELTFVPERLILTALKYVDEPSEGVEETDAAPAMPRCFHVLMPKAEERQFRHCLNRMEHQACNWAVAVEGDQTLCVSCRMNDVIPNLNEPADKKAWLKIETAKRRLIYTLIKLGLSVTPRGKDNPNGLAFSFLREIENGPKVLTGHANGLITLNIDEADDVIRTRTRLELGEAYRTLLGHFRHESGHFYWDRLIAPNPSWLERFRTEFGDERADYAAALQRHYAEGPSADWENFYVSAYAGVHPWEDWAETWAHYLHIMDALETARSYGLALKPLAATGEQEEPAEDEFDELVRRWISVSLALNSFNRGMGRSDLYPFNLSASVTTKLRFVHELIASGR